MFIRQIMVDSFTLTVPRFCQLYPGAARDEAETSWRQGPTRAAKSVRARRIPYGGVAVIMKLFRVAFAEAVLAISLAVTLVSAEISSRGVETPPLAKTVFSSRMRMVLAVGVEGTGHDLVLQVHDHMVKENDQLLALPGELHISAGPYHIYNSMGTDVHHYSVALGNAKRQMRNMATMAAELSYPGTIALLHGRYSYPDGWGPKKVMKYLDLRMLAEVAEEEGVDFRVLYLRRSVHDMIIANTVHRNFQK